MRGEQSFLVSGIGQITTRLWITILWRMQDGFGR